MLINGDAEGLARRIETFEFTEESVRAELAMPGCFEMKLAFQTILRNRAQRGGIMAPGAGLMRTGENGKGVASRWYPETLARRIRAIVEYRDRINFSNGDGLAVMGAHVGEQNTVLFVDPPYTAGGKSAGCRLYEVCELDHKRLFRLARRHKGDVLLTYDNAPEVRELAAQHGFLVRPIAMRSTHNAEMSELLIGRRLGWIC